ncbi:MAG: hypothetical protein P4L83_16520 [Nevskia sp.]|nr:hypothetical protein [Nevskia sp.]
MSARFHGFGLAAAATLLAVSAGANAQSDEMTYGAENDNTPSSGSMLVDLMLLRPLSLAGTVLGTGIFIAGLPFEALSGDVSGPARRLVTDPAKFTFTRPLGETR